MSGGISSRTPEGVPNHCPVCGLDLCLEPSQPPGDAPCPGCGSLLWFSRTPDGFRVYESTEIAPLQEQVLEVIREHWRYRAIEPWTSFLEDLGADSLDLVDLIMDLEERFGLTIPDEDAEQLKTVRDLIDYILQHRPPG